MAECLGNEKEVENEVGLSDSCVRRVWSPEGTISITVYGNHTLKSHLYHNI